MSRPCCKWLARKLVKYVYCNLSAVGNITYWTLMNGLNLNSSPMVDGTVGSFAFLLL